MKFTVFPLLKYCNIKLCVITTTVLFFPTSFFWEAEVQFFMCGGKNFLRRINHWPNSKAVLIKYRVSYTKDLHT